MPDQSLKLTPDEIRAFVAKAREKSSRSWVPENQPNATTIEQVHRRFDSSLISPEQAEIDVDSDFAGLLGIEPGAHRVWFLTAPTPQRVFLDERTMRFGVAWGPDSNTKKFVDLGFRTDDPIDAFLA